ILIPENDKNPPPLPSPQKRPGNRWFSTFYGPITTLGYENPRTVSTAFTLFFRYFKVSFLTTLRCMQRLRGWNNLDEPRYTTPCSLSSFASLRSAPISSPGSPAYPGRICEYSSCGRGACRGGLAWRRRRVPPGPARGQSRRRQGGSGQGH